MKMKIALLELQYDEIPLIWEYDPIANTAVCNIPEGAEKLFKLAFQGNSNTTIKKHNFIINHASEFFEQGKFTVKAVTSDSSFIPLSLEPLSKTTIEEQLTCSLKELHPEILAGIYLELDRENPLIMENPFLLQAIVNARSDPDFSSNKNWATSSTSTGFADPAIVGRVLVELSGQVSDYDSIYEDSLPENRYINGSSSTTQASGTRSRFSSSQSSSRSVAFFTPGTKNLNLNDILNKEKQLDTEYRDTFIHEDGKFLRITQGVSKALNDYPIHTYESFNLSVATLERNTALYQVKHKLISEFRSLFDDSIDPAWLMMSSSRKDDNSQRVLSAWFKQSIHEIMRAIPEANETEKQWQKRINERMHRLELLINNKISIKNLSHERQTGKLLQDLSDGIKQEPGLKQAIQDNLKNIRGFLKDIGEIEFQAQVASKKIKKATDQQDPDIRGNRLFSDIIKGSLKGHSLSGNSQDVADRASKIAITAIKRCHDAVISRLKESGLQPDDPLYISIIKDPANKINGYTRRLLSHYFYMGKPMLENFQSGLNAVIKELGEELKTSKGITLFIQHVERLLELQVSGTLTRLFEKELQQARSLSSSAAQVPPDSAESDEPGHRPEP